MSDVLGIGISGLLAFQRALSTVGHNIVNANTEGYSRQQVDFSTRPEVFEGNSFYGNGVQVSSVRRVVNEFFQETYRSNISVHNKESILFEHSSQIDELVADADTGMSAALENFFSAVEGVANDPGSIPSREIMLTQGRIVTERFSRLDEQLRTLSSQVDAQYEQLAEEVNAIASSISQLNINILESSGQGSAPPNDMLDQRDRLLNQLAEIINVTVVKDTNNVANVSIGAGTPLVTGQSLHLLGVRDSVSDPSEQELTVSIDGVVETLNLQGVSGKIGGLYEFRTEILDIAENSLGQLAIGLAETVNAQHKLGIDLNDTFGGNFFNDLTLSDAVANQNNRGTAGFTVDITDATKLTSSDYELIFNGEYVLTRLQDNTVIGTYQNFPQTVTTEGFQLTLAGTPTVGDSFLIQPTKQGAVNIDLDILTAAQIAAASPIRVLQGQLDSNGNILDVNIGTGQIDQGQVSAVQFTTSPPPTGVDAAESIYRNNGQLTPPLRILFTKAGNPPPPDAPTSFTTTFVIQDISDPNNPVTLQDATGLSDQTYAFNRNLPNELFSSDSQGTYIDYTTTGPLTTTRLYLGFQASINGDPESGDSFEIHYNLGGDSDNRNLNAIVAQQTSDLLLNGTATYRETYGQMVAGVGNKTREADISQEASLALLRQSQARNDSVSGVNLDEEAAKLIQLQSAYQAAAQIINAGSKIIDELIAATR